MGGELSSARGPGGVLTRPRHNVPRGGSPLSSQRAVHVGTPMRSRGGSLRGLAPAAGMRGFASRALHAVVGAKPVLFGCRGSPAGWVGAPGDLREAASVCADPAQPARSATLHDPALFTKSAARQLPTGERPVRPKVSTSALGHGRKTLIGPVLLLRAESQTAASASARPPTPGLGITSRSATRCSYAESLSDSPVPVIHGPECEPLCS